MANWNDIERAAPDLAATARAHFTATTNAVLATLRQDGSPRVSGIDPIFLDGELWLGSMPDSRKGADLDRDARLALHCVPWESRGDRGGDGEDQPATGDAKLTGLAVRVTDPAAFERIVAHSEEATGQSPPTPFDLFTVDVRELVCISVEDDQLVIDGWSAASGRKRVTRR
jgi:hypothetical protein